MRPYAFAARWLHADLGGAGLGLTVIEIGLITRLQRVAVRGPIPAAANALSTFGEHSAGWLLIAGAGFLVDSRRRSTWASLAVAAFAAHACAVVIKRIVRRQRPLDDSIQVLDSTPSRLSFPSAHTASSTAVAVTLAPVIGWGPAGVLPVLMGTGRVLLGVHYPTDVVAGAAAGLLVGRIARRTVGIGR